MIALALIISLVGLAGFGLGVWLMDDIRPAGIDYHPALDGPLGAIVDHGQIEVRR